MDCGDIADFNDYRETLINGVISFCNQISSKKKYCIHIPHQGNKYFKNKELLVIGRAQNGVSSNKATFTSKKFLENSENIYYYLANNRSLDWMNEYNKSSFIRIIRNYLLQKNSTYEDWYNYFVWSNLMKVSPATKGNPTNKEWEIQKTFCMELFKKEIDFYKPKLILMMTDFNWAYDFLEFLKINPNATEITNRNKYIKGLYTYKQSQIMIFERPEGKNEEKYVNTIYKYLEKK